jgi:hypothetical protein
MYQITRFHINNPPTAVDATDYSVGAYAFIDGDNIQWVAAKTVAIQIRITKVQLTVVLEATVEHRVNRLGSGPQLPDRAVVDERPDVIVRQPAHLVVQRRDNHGLEIGDSRTQDDKLGHQAEAFTDLPCRPQDYDHGQFGLEERLEVEVIV